MSCESYEHMNAYSLHLLHISMQMHLHPNMHTHACIIVHKHDHIYTNTQEHGHTRVSTTHAHKNTSKWRSGCVHFYVICVVPVLFSESQESRLLNWSHQFSAVFQWLLQIPHMEAVHGCVFIVLSLRHTSMPFVYIIYLFMCVRGFMYLGVKCYVFMCYWVNVLSIYVLMYVYE